MSYFKGRKKNMFTDTFVNLKLLKTNNSKLNFQFRANFGALQEILEELTINTTCRKSNIKDFNNDGIFFAKIFNGKKAINYFCKEAFS